MMTVFPVEITTKTIRLAQFLKLADAAGDGVEAKFRIVEGQITVNGEIETRRGRKLSPGDLVECAGTVYEVCGGELSAG